jgi:flagellar assembly protein FliH
MQWRKTLQPGLPLQDVRLLRQPPGPTETGEAARAREHAAFERGIAEGEKRLGEQLLRQRAEVLELQNGVLASLRNTLPRVVQQSEQALIELAFEVARKLVNDLPIDRERVEAAVRTALTQVEEITEYHVALHPDDLALLQQCSSPVLLPGPGNEAVHFSASPEVSRGGCLVQTRFGIVDTRRETKLEMIRQALQG